MISAIKLLLGSGGTDVAELPFFIGATYTSAWVPYNIRKIGTGKYAYITKWNAGPTGNVGDYEDVWTTWWSPDGVIPVQSCFFYRPNNKGYIHPCRKFAGYKFSTMTMSTSTGYPEEPIDRFLNEGFVGADELGASGISTDPAARYNQPQSSNGASGVESPNGGSGFNVYAMYEYDTDMLDVERLGYDYSNSSYRLMQYYQNGSGYQLAYIARLNSSGTQQWAKSFGTSVKEPSLIRCVIPLSNGKTLITTGGGDHYMMMNSDGSVQYNRSNGDFCNQDNEPAIDSSETYAYSVNNGGECMRMTLSNGDVHKMSIKSASSVPSSTINFGDSQQKMFGFDSDGYLWFISPQYGINRVDVSNASSPQIVGTYKTRGRNGYDYCTPAGGLVDGDRVFVFTTGWANSTYDAYGGFVYCLKTDFSTTTVDSQNGDVFNNRYGLTAQNGDGGRGYLTAYTSAATGTWQSDSASNVTSFSITDRASYNWSTNYNNYKSLMTQNGNSYPQNAPIV